MNKNNNKILVISKLKIVYLQVKTPLNLLILKMLIIMIIKEVYTGNRLKLDLFILINYIYKFTLF